MLNVNARHADIHGRSAIEDFQHHMRDVTTLGEVRNALSRIIQKVIGASGIVFFPLHWGIKPDTEVVLHSEHIHPREAEALAIPSLPGMNRELGFLSSCQKEGADTRNVMDYYGRQFLRSTRSYREVIRPCRINHMLSAFMRTEQRANLGYLLITRSDKEPSFADRDLKLTDSIRVLTEQSLNDLAHADGDCCTPMDILTALASNLPQSCAILDHNGRLVWANKTAEQQLGGDVISISGKYLLCSRSAVIENWQRAIRQCVMSMISNSDPSNEVVVHCIERLPSNPVYLIVDNSCRTHRHASLKMLSAREKQIAELAAQGYSPLNIGAMLAISVGTVRIHLKSIYRKLRVASRVELALRFQF